MGKKTSNSSVQKNPPIRGYLPICITLPTIDVKDRRHSYTSFIYVKEHIKKSNNSDERGAALFVANAPSNGPIRTDLFLRALFEPYGDIQRVTVTQNPKKGGGTSSFERDDDVNAAGEIFREAALAGLDGVAESTESRNRRDGKFAHVVFTSAKGLKKALKSLQSEMSESDDLFTLTLSDDKMEELKVETAQLLSSEGDGIEVDDEEEDVDEENDATQATSLTGIQAVAEQARQKAYRHMSRQQLMQLCNETMAAYEDQEAEAERRAKLAAEQPDEDGFITVTHGTTPSFGAANDFEEEKHGAHRRKAGKRSRKRKATGADEQQDFYRFQMKETRKKEVQDLKARFEEDLKKVRKMKEQKAFRPF
eukprot:scaffold1804_cov134-Skeletonema_marinoi.AAC.7